MDDLRKVSLVCEQCGGTLLVDDAKEVMACPYCGSKTLIIESDAVTMERIRTSAQKEVELERIRAVDREQQRLAQREQEREMSNQTERFRKSKWFKFLIVGFFIAAFCAYSCFSKGRILGGILSVIQAGCFAVAWTMGMQIIKEKKRYMHILIALLGVILFVPTFKACSKAPDVEEVKWSVIFLGEEIPEPNSKKLDIHTNTADELWIDVVETSKEEYYEYISSCKEAGYIIEVKEDSIGYKAYNEEGFYLELSSYGEEMRIKLEAPMETEELNWNQHDISSVLPQPKSQLGAYITENEEYVTVIVSKTSKEDYLQYCEECKSLGFETDAETGSNYYGAYDVEGNKLHLSHTNGNSEMEIRLTYAVELPDNGSDETETITESDSNDQTETEVIKESDSTEDFEADAGVVTPEFKEMMDSYEEFFDEYVELMNKVSTADSMEMVELMGKYSEYMQKYTEIMEKMDAINQEELSVADALYYTEVTTRIYQKMAKTQ